MSIEKSNCSASAEAPHYIGLWQDMMGKNSHPCRVQWRKLAKTSSRIRTLSCDRGLMDLDTPILPSTTGSQFWTAFGMGHGKRLTLTLAGFMGASLSNVTVIDRDYRLCLLRSYMQHRARTRQVQVSKPTSIWNVQNTLVSDERRHLIIILLMSVID